jgi:hypothetical protein
MVAQTQVNGRPHGRGRAPVGPDRYARLRAAAAAMAERSRAAGREDGRAWAADLAEPAQLRRLALGGGFAAVRGVGPGELPVALYAAVMGYASEFTDPAESDAFWERLLPGDPDAIRDDYFTAGFVAGALEVWEEVRPRP